jgi:hypothetical protein
MPRAQIGNLRRQAAVLGSRHCDRGVAGGLGGVTVTAATLLAALALHHRVKLCEASRWFF